MTSKRQPSSKPSRSKILWAVFATPSPGSSDTTRRLVALVRVSEELAQKVAVAHFCNDWVQDNWDDYDQGYVEQMRHAVARKDWEAALVAQELMSGYRIEIEEWSVIARIRAPVIPRPDVVEEDVP